MSNAEIVAKVKEIYSDLDKICDAATMGKVPKWLNEKGEVTDWYDYTMSNNAFNDVCGLWQSVRMLLIEMGEEIC